MYDSIPPQIRAQIIRSCNKYGISSPEDVETAYNNFTQEKSIFEGLSDSFYRAQAFKKFLEGGVISHKYSGEDEPTGKMTISKLNKKSIVPVSVWHTPKGYTYNLPEVTVTPQSNPDDMLKMRRAINQGMNKTGEIGAEALSYASMAPAILAAPGAALLGLVGGAAGASTGAKIGEYIAGDTGALYGGIAGGLIGGGLGTSFASPSVRSFINSSNTGKWTKFGNKEYRLNPNTLSVNGGVPESRGLPEALRAKGWTLANDGARVSPEGKRFVINSDGKWQSESSLSISNKIKANKDAEISRIKEQESLKNKILSEFEDNKITGFSTEEWKAARKGFKTTDSQVKEYESHLPEYYNIFKSLTNNGQLVKENGKWLGKINEQMVPVNPRQYIISQSKNFQNNGWKYDGYDRGLAIYPANKGKGIRHDVETVQKTGGIGLSDWTTTNKSQQSFFSKQRDDGPILRGIVSTSTNSDRIIPKIYAHEASNNSYKGISDFNAPIDFKGEKGLWRIYGPDMQIKAIDGNIGAFNRNNPDPLGALLLPVFGLSTLLPDQ